MPPCGERVANATGRRILILAPSRCSTSSTSSPSPAVPVPRRAVHICSMMESTSPTGQSASVLVFENGRAAGVWIVPIGAVAFAAVVMTNSAAWSTPESSGVVVACLLIASLFSIIASSRWIAEIDLRARTLRISRRSFGRWTKTSVHCSLDQCRKLGRIEYETFQEAGRVASQIPDLTAIPRLDARF